MLCPPLLSTARRAPAEEPPAGEAPPDTLAEPPPTAAATPSMSEEVGTRLSGAVEPTERNDAKVKVKLSMSASSSVSDETGTALALTPLQEESLTSPRKRRWRRKLSFVSPFASPQSQPKGVRRPLGSPPLRLSIDGSTEPRERRASGVSRLTNMFSPLQVPIRLRPSDSRDPNSIVERRARLAGSLLLRGNGGAELRDAAYGFTAITEVSGGAGGEDGVQSRRLSGMSAMGYAPAASRRPSLSSMAGSITAFFYGDTGEQSPDPRRSAPGAAGKLSLSPPGGISVPPESDDDDEERAPSKATDAEMPPPPPLFSLVIEGDAPHKGGMGPSGLESNQCVNAELNGLQLVLMPTRQAWCATSRVRSSWRSCCSSTSSPISRSSRAKSRSPSPSCRGAHPACRPGGGLRSLRAGAGAYCRTRARCTWRKIPC